MSERLSNSLINITQRQALIRALPVFSVLTPSEREELAQLMYEMRYETGEAIVLEDGLIDSVFIIVSGQAEVSRQYIKRTKIRKKIKKIIKTPLATIGDGDAIGLNDTGFFSSTGKRTATVTATSDVHLLVIDLKDLHRFLSSHAELQTEMQATAGQLLRINLIKQSLPFNRLSHERLQWLANQVEEMSIPAGTMIFKEGEVGDRCYLIRSGQVEVYNKNEDGTERHLAILKSPTLFGEATLITNSPRNASARAVENCELLALKHEFLSELIESESNVAHMLMTLMVDRSRPSQNPHVITHRRTTPDGQEIVILKNPDNGNYFKLSEEGWFIWEQLNGKQTMQDITLALADKFDIFAPDVVAALVSKLAKTGFIENVEVEKEDLSSNPLWVRAMIRMRRILEAQIAIGDADKWLTSFYRRFAYVIFTPVGKLLIAFFAIAGMIACGYSTSHVIQIYKTIPDSWVLFVLLVPFTILSVALHELGHALATKSFGYEVHYMGVGWYWMSPVAFTDTSDMWLSTRWPRTAVNLAGICTDILTAGISSLLIFVIHNPYVQGFLWIFAIYTYINAFRMLSPLQELDGYYVLMDLLERPHLRQSSVIWLVKDFSKTWRNPRLIKKYLPEILYWLACIVFLILVSLLTIFVQSFIFKILGFKPANPIMGLMLPFIVVIVSSLGIIADIRKSED